MMQTCLSGIVDICVNLYKHIKYLSTRTLPGLCGLVSWWRMVFGKYQNRWNSSLHQHVVLSITFVKINLTKYRIVLCPCTEIQGQLGQGMLCWDLPNKHCGFLAWATWHLLAGWLYEHSDHLRALIVFTSDWRGYLVVINKWPTVKLIYR